MISVIVVNYHTAHLAARAVQSVLQEAGDVEVFVVDNTASDGERDALRSILPAEVTLLLNRTNEGFAKACNRAFAVSRGEHILLLNPDAYSIPPALRAMSAFLSVRTDAGAVSPQVFWDDDMRYLFPVYPFPSPVADFLHKLSSLSRTVGFLYSFHERKKNLLLWQSSVPVRVRNLHGGVVLLKRSAVERAGGLFDERFFLFYEDADLFLRLRKSGYRLYIVPDIRAVHNYSHTGKKMEIMSETRALYYGKNFHGTFLRSVSGLIPDRPADTSRYEDYGSWDSPPSFAVPPDLRGAYLFEWSPIPLFVPSIGLFGQGETFGFSEKVFSLLGDGVYYCRFTSPSKHLCRAKTFYWRKCSQ